MEVDPLQLHRLLEVVYPTLDAEAQRLARTWQDRARAAMRVEPPLPVRWALLGPQDHVIDGQPHHRAPRALAAVHEALHAGSAPAAAYYPGPNAVRVMRRALRGQALDWVERNAPCLLSLVAAARVLGGRVIVERHQGQRAVSCSFEVPDLVEVPWAKDDVASTPDGDHDRVQHQHRVDR